MTEQNINTEIININEFIQGTPLPFSVLNNKYNNAAYPDKKLEIRNGGFGSDAAAHPTNPNQFYVLTDRGPNADFNGCAGAGKLFLTPNYTPRIGLFELQANSQIIKIKDILLKDTHGHPITGLPNPKSLGGTNEIPYDVDGQLMVMNPQMPFDETSNPIRTDINGLDPEGLAALNDGSFWISDEYGPHLVHYDADGIELARINPFANDERNNLVIDGKQLLLPAEFANRRANRGMESLTITPDQTTLVGVIESSLDNPDKVGRDADVTRIITINVVTGHIAQYLYRLDTAKHVNSGIVAINDHEFYIIEHDRKMPLQEVNAQKHIYKIDITQATNIEDVANQVMDNHYNLEQNEALGLMINAQTLEQFLAFDKQNWQVLAELNIKPVRKTLVVDVIGAVDYPHDKLEGLWLRQDGSLGLLNDDDFCITDSAVTDSESLDSTIDKLDNLIEQKYLDHDKTIEDANRLYIVMPSE